MHVHFSAAPAASPVRLRPVAAMLPAIHCLTAGLSLLVLHVMLLLLIGLLARAGLRRSGGRNDLPAAGTATGAATALHALALTALALALTALRSLGEAGAHRKPSQYRAQQENPGYR